MTNLPEMTFLVDTSETYCCLKCNRELLASDVLYATKDDGRIINRQCPKCGAIDNWFAHRAWGKYWASMGIKMEPRNLPCGDISVKGFEQSGLIVERKSLDFLAAVGSERSRFDREIEASKSYDGFAIIVEMSEYALWESRRGLQWWAVQRSIGTWMARHLIPVYLATSPRSAAEMAVAYLMTQVVDKLDAERITKRKERKCKPAKQIKQKRIQLQPPPME
jgi:ERCC4-type nuclease